MGAAYRRRARGGRPLNTRRQDIGAGTPRDIPRATWRWTRALVLAGSFATLGALPLAGQQPRAPRNAKRPPLPDISCVVAKLADGDSFKCADGREVRLLLMDTPEMAQAPWGVMARRQLEALVRPGMTVRLELDRTAVDRYRRTLAYVWVDTVMVNERMVASGWAIVLAYENVRHLERIKRAERAAQDARRGFWQTWAFRCRPVDFRARRCG